MEPKYVSQPVVVHVSVTFAVRMSFTTIVVPMFQMPVDEE